MNYKFSFYKLGMIHQKHALLRLTFLFVLGLVLVAPVAYAESPTRDELWTDTLRMVRDDFPRVRHLSTEDLAKLLEKQPGITILDTRESEEFEVSHIQGAVLARDANDAIEALKDQELDDVVVVYCSVGYRSSRIAAILNRRGYSNVFNLEGSLFKWANENRPIYSGDEKAEKVHPYDESWGRLLQQKYLPE